ncbi:MAG: glycosyltransferase family 39 protein [Anaerolineae bacterium]|nr:glycosyltransferase family 39 protein [Anaerolineae bacterium]
MSFGQTFWGNLAISFCMFLIVFLPLFFILSIYVLNKMAPRRAGFTGFVLRRALTLILFLAALLALALYLTPYESVLGLARSFSPDGQISSLNGELYGRVRLALGLGGLACLLAGGLSLLFKKRLSSLLKTVSLWLVDEASRWAVAAGEFWADLRKNRPSLPEWLGLAGLCLSAAVVRAFYLNKPFLHDEAYTYVGFASRSLRAVMTDYSLPNNHVLHSILVHFSTLLFGVEPWAVRLPSYLAGILCVFAAYFLARRLYKRPTAWLAAALVAASPDLATKSADARGYMILALISLLIFWLGAGLRLKSNRFAWLLLAVLSALGFYDVPTMMYPFGALMAWLGLSALLGDLGPADKRWPFIMRLVACGLGAGLLTLLLYAPILIASGPQSLFGNPFVRPMDWADFTAIVPVHWDETWGAWSYGIKAAPLVFGLGLLLSLIFNRPLSGQRLPQAAVTVLFIAAAVTLQRANPWARLWTFLLPLLWVWVAAGWVWLATRLLARREAWLKPVLGGLVLLALLNGLWNSFDFYRQGGTATGTVEQMVLGIRDKLQPGDVVLSVSVYEPPMWYYFRRHAIPWIYFDLPADGRAARYVVITYSDEGETVQSILQKRKVPAAAYDPAAETTLYQTGSVTVEAIAGR